MKTPAELDAEKQRAAEAAVQWVHSGMRIGLGTGTTAEYFARALAVAIKEGRLHNVAAVPTSEKIAAFARGLGIPLFELDGSPPLDLTIDGADEIDPQLRLIKGGGGALLREKIVATASKRNLIVADSSKMVPQLGNFPLPVEVAPFAAAWIKAQLEAEGSRVTLRRNEEGIPIHTDQGLLLLDCHFGNYDAPRISDPETLQKTIASLPGVIGHGLFLDTTDELLIADGETLTLHIRGEGKRIL